LSDAAVSYAFEPLEPSNPPARDAAARLLALATAEAVQIRERARAEGYAEGYRLGHTEGAAEVSRAADALSQATREIESLRADTVEAVEDDAIELALDLAEKIVGGTLKANPDAVIEVVRGALDRIGERRGMTVLVNPADLDTVKAAIDELTARGGGAELCELRSEERVGTGGAIVRTVEGEIDASTYTQLDRAREVVEHSLVAAGRAA
jgi:flagellar assembly protein FliH